MPFDSRTAARRFSDMLSVAAAATEEQSMHYPIQPSSQ